MTGAAKNTVVDDQAQMLVGLGLQPISIGVDSFALRGLVGWVGFCGLVAAFSMVATCEWLLERITRWQD